MGLISQTLKNLISGVSQQPPILRHAEQLQEQINGFSTESGGLQKRPPSIHVKKLPKIPTNSYLHFVNRDENERYIMAFTGDGLRIFDLQGSEKQVNFQGSAKAYLTNGEPKNNLKAVTVADYTFLINRTIRTQLDNNSKTPDSFNTQGTLIVVKQGQYGRDYTININGSVYTHTTPDGSDAKQTKEIATNRIADLLFQKIISGSVLFKDLPVSTLQAKGIQVKTTEGFSTKNVWNQQGKVGENPDYYGKDALRDGITKGSIKDITRSYNNAWNEKVFFWYNGQVYYGTDHIAENRFTAYHEKNWIVINNQDNVTVSDGFNGEALKAFKSKVNSFNDLPATAPDGFTVLVSGETNSSDDYYVKYNAEDSVWKECASPNIITGIKASTMPVIIIREANGTFTVKEAEWNKREAGDEDSNPTPSFIGNTINDIFFFRNRLGIISGESVNLSKSGDFFNFWVDSATGVVDTDPIDLSVSHTRISILYNAVPFNQDLYLFSQQTQFILSADGVLSPKTVVINQVTEFTADPLVKPIGIGRNLYFTAKRTDYTSVREYYAVADSTTQKDATDITGHVPAYLPNTIYDLIACQNENILMALSTAKRNAFYVYKFLFMDNQKVQASWSKWELDGTIIGADFINSILYYFIERQGNTYLEYIPINYNTKDWTEEPYRIMLDRKQKVTLTGTYDESKQTMTYDIKALYGDTQDTEYQVVFPNGEHYKGTNQIVLYDQLTPKEATTAFIGVPYNLQFELSTFYIKQQDQTGTTTIPNYRLQLRNLEFNYANTGEFNVAVLATGKKTYNYKMTARYTGSPTNILAVHPIETGVFKVPVMGKNTDVRIVVTNDSPLPSNFNTLVWQGNVTYQYRKF